MSATEPKKYGVGERALADIIADLSKPIPARLIETKTISGHKIEYISWHTAVKFLDLFAPGWSYEIPKIIEIGDRLIVIARISIPHAEGITYREATGQENKVVSGYGDSSSNAESMALRRAAAKFGLNLAGYEK